MRKVALLLFATVALLSWNASAPVSSEDMTVQQALIALGEAPPAHYVQTLDSSLVQMGRAMVYEGRTKRAKGGYSNYISNIYVCTDCHNQVKEDPNLAQPDPESRLAYAKDKDLPFLQATTFWGMVNRETWYNDDYPEKYGALVDEARNSLKAATQLCAKECSSGRYLEPWEEEVMNHYYWSLQLNLSDLNLSEKETEQLERAIASRSQQEKGQGIRLLKSKYMLKSPADFVEPPSDRSKGFELEGSVEDGQEIYDRSCMTCHRYGGPSLFTLNHSKATFKLLKKNIDRGHSPYALYDIVRHGTYSEPGHRQYMPLYTADRMSDRQLEGLRAYIEKMAK